MPITNRLGKCSSEEFGVDKVGSFEEEVIIRDSAEHVPGSFDESLDGLKGGEKTYAAEKKKEQIANHKSTQVLQICNL